METAQLSGWLIMADKDTISVSDGHSFSTDPLLSINYLTITNQTRLSGSTFSRLTEIFPEYHVGVKSLH